MYNCRMKHKDMKIEKIIARFLSFSTSVEKYLQRQGPLTPLQLRSISLTVSMMQIYLDIWIKRDGQSRKSIGVNDAFSSAAAVLGRLGGSKGGKARAEKLSPKKRAAIARLAAAARWAKYRGTRA